MKCNNFLYVFFVMKYYTICTRTNTATYNSINIVNHLFLHCCSVVLYIESHSVTSSLYGRFKIIIYSSAIKVPVRNRIFKGFHTFDFILNDHKYITLLHMHTNFYFQFPCESVVFTSISPQNVKYKHLGFIFF